MATLTHPPLTLTLTLTLLSAHTLELGAWLGPCTLCPGLPHQCTQAELPG